MFFGETFISPSAAVSASKRHTLFSTFMRSGQVLILDFLPRWKECSLERSFQRSNHFEMSIILSARLDEGSSPALTTYGRCLWCAAPAALPFAWFDVVRLYVI